jgi:apolipoprotein D and lipocalin family protein
MNKLVVAICLSIAAMAQANQEVETVEYVDLNQYLGKWYEVASIPQSFQKQCISNTTAEYSLDQDGLIVVINSCETADGSRSIAEGRARVEDKDSNAKLKVTFVKIFDWVFAFGGNYWIIDLGANYEYALVGDPTRDYAWILSRTPAVDMEFFKAADAKFREQGYDTCKILTSIQDGGTETRQALCEVVK